MMDQGELGPSWFAGSAVELAPRLLGCRLVVAGVIGRITETEAYQGTDDRACHAHKGRTPRTETLFGAPGTLYVYLCYGIHHLLNIVCDAVDTPAAVLIRGLAIEAGGDLVRARRGRPGGLDHLTNGPGKVTQALGLSCENNGQHLGPDGPLQVISGPPPEVICSGPRVGVAYAGPDWAGRPWRFWDSAFPVAKG